MTDSIELPRETIELLATTVSVDGTPVSGYQVAVAARGARPATWAAPVTAGSTVGPLINGPTLGVGVFTVWAKYTDSPEAPVIELGNFRIT